MTTGPRITDHDLETLNHNVTVFHVAIERNTRSLWCCSVLIIFGWVVLIAYDMTTKYIFPPAPAAEVGK